MIDRPKSAEYRIWENMISRASDPWPSLIWRTYDSVGLAMVVPAFRATDGTVGKLEGRCRGLGPIGADLRPNEDPIGLWDAKGNWHVIHIDLEGCQEEESFSIGGECLHFPILRCFTMHDRVRPKKGTLRPQMAPASFDEASLGLIDPLGMFGPDNARWVYSRLSNE